MDLNRFKGFLFSVMLLALMFLPVNSAVSYVSAEEANEEDFTLSIMHMNDTHAHVEPLPQMMTAINEVRAEKPDSLLLHAGDVFSGTLYFNAFKGQADLALMNLMDIDAMVYGNHEFDLGNEEGGHESLAAFVEGANFPLLGTNIDFSQDTYMQDVVSNEHMAANPDGGESYYSIVKNVDGEEVGVFGLTSEDTANISTPADVTFQNYIDTAEEAVAEFEDNGIDKIVALTHIGYDSDPSVGNDLLLGQVEGIDVIVGGHSHSELAEPAVVEEDSDGNPKDPTVIVQAGDYAQNLGTLDVTFDEDGAVAEYTGELLTVDNYEADSDASEVLQEYADQIDELENEEIGATALKPLENPRQSEPGGDSVRANETELGNLVTDAMLSKAQEKFPDTTIAFQNGGGIRAPIDEGPITVGEVISVLPFGNDPVTAVLTGAEIKDILEHSVHLAPNEHGGFLHVSGMQLTYDSEREPGDRVVEMLVNQDGELTPVDPEAEYRITTNGFTGQGGDGFETFEQAYEDGRIRDIGEIDWQQLVDYMVEDLDGVVDPEREGRIVDLKGEELPGDGDEGNNPPPHAGEPGPPPHAGEPGPPPHAGNSGPPPHAGQPGPPPHANN